MEDLNQKRLQFLEETVTFYNSNNRANNYGSCKYLYKDGELTKKCAIGRHLSDELCEILDEDYHGGSVSRDVIFIQLPEELQALGQDFLKRVQHLHDTFWFWTPEGISEEGKKEVEIIKREYGLNVSNV